MIHELKELPEYFEAVTSGKKEFEIRLNDRCFKEGDYLALNEYKDGQYTGRSCMVYVDYILNSFDGLAPKYVAMSIKPCRVIKRNNLFNPINGLLEYGVPILEGTE